MSPEKKKQRRCDLLTTIALFLGLVFTADSGRSCF